MFANTEKSDNKSPRKRKFQTTVRRQEIHPLGFDPSPVLLIYHCCPGSIISGKSLFLCGILNGLNGHNKQKRSRDLRDSACVGTMRHMAIYMCINTIRLGIPANKM